MTIEKSIPLRHPLLWQALALLMLGSTVWATLAPRPPHLAIGILGWDKAQHAVVYACLMWWCVQAFQRCGLFFWAAILFLMGGSLELLQNQTGSRHMELTDIVANGVGILVGFLLWLTPLGRTLQAAELWFTRDRGAPAE